MPEVVTAAVPGRKNLRVVLARRPEGAPSLDCFRLEESDIPEPADGEVLLQTEYLSLDPYMRGRMNDGPSYAEPVPLGGVMAGHTVSRVASSRNPNYAVRDRVVADAGWQSWAISDGTGLLRIPPDLEDPAYALGVLGMPGFTAYMGLLDIGKPRAGETLLVSAATGAVGSVVGQIGKMLGCRVVGIAGGPEKCGYAVETLAYDACIDHRADDLPARLRAACPQGVDIYFENVGGHVFEAAFPLLNRGARVPVCGLIAHYNSGFLAPGPNRTPLLLANLVVKRIRMQGFLIFDHYAESFEEFSQAMSEWLRAGKVHYRQDMVTGLEAAPQAFIGLLEGRNFGKLIVRVNAA